MSLPFLFRDILCGETLRYSVQRHKVKGSHLSAAPFLITLVLPDFDLGIGIRQITGIQAYLGNTGDLVPDHGNKANIMIKQVT